MIWKEVLEAERFQRGYLEVDTGMMRYGGPIARMMMGDTNNKFTFVLAWCAQTDSGEGPACARQWEICEDQRRLTVEFDYTLTGIPREASDTNSFRFKISGVGNAILLPQGYFGQTGTILQPVMVRGLVLEHA